MLITIPVNKLDDIDKMPEFNHNYYTYFDKFFGGFVTFVTKLGELDQSSTCSLV